jgi:MFS family permease
VLFVPLVLLSPAAGVVVDRFDRRRVMIASDATGAAAVGGARDAQRGDPRPA